MEMQVTPEYHNLDPNLIIRPAMFMLATSLKLPRQQGLLEALEMSMLQSAVCMHTNAAQMASSMKACEVQEHRRMFKLHLYTALSCIMLTQPITIIHASSASRCDTLRKQTSQHY